MHPELQPLFKNVLHNWWHWDLEEFARRCRLRPEEPYTVRQFDAFRSLYEALYAIDHEVFAVVASASGEEATATVDAVAAEKQRVLEMVEETFFRR
jgi:hypothetical protein